jgi:hypothetical protein
MLKFRSLNRRYLILTTWSIKIILTFNDQTYLITLFLGHIIIFITHLNLTELVLCLFSVHHLTKTLFIRDKR